jgi:hypothetical protein
VIAVRGQTQHRAAAAFVFVTLVLGTLILCIGIPVGGAWALSKVTSSQGGHYIAVLLLIPFAMAMFTPVLFWLNRLYLRIRETGRAGEPGRDWDEEWDEGDDEPRLIPRGPLEPLLLISFALALVAIVIWFFFFAENPLLW